MRFEYPPQRTETVVFKFTVDKQLYAKHREEIDMFCSDGSRYESMIEGDTLNLNYKFYVEYYGMIVQRFNVLLNLIEAGIVVDFNYEELKHGRSLVFELGRLLERFDKKTKEESEIK